MVTSPDLGSSRAREDDTADIVAVTSLMDHLQERYQPAPTRLTSQLGETIADPEKPIALPVMHIDEPTVAMLFSSNVSPFAGKEGKFGDVTGAVGGIAGAEHAAHRRADAGNRSQPSSRLAAVTVADRAGPTASHRRSTAAVGVTPAARRLRPRRGAGAAR